MKFACLDEISAPLMRLPLRPLFSIIRAATSPAGFFPDAAAEASASGWVGLLDLEALLHLFLDLGQRLAMERRRQPISTAPGGALKFR